ncbi:MAG: type II toxin-antitoxin system MqsA family antitoxin [Armatimonadetes bacterium]|jgi:YgiT-type zinc finger domain-containing protein|nr:type II toxin-antitoxin system MqsA family antitoxin [Armatimonadota bacterium]
MKCIVCRQDRTEPGETTVTLERDDLTMVVRGVPARVCPNCGEAYVDDLVASGLLLMAEEVAQSGVSIDVRRYMPMSY